MLRGTLATSQGIGYPGNMQEKLYTVPQAAMLKGVTRQAMSLWIQKHLHRCQPIQSIGKKGRIPTRQTVLWLIPHSLLGEYCPSTEHQQSGSVQKTVRNSRVTQGKKKR